jgi:hypothetical protein
LGGCCARTVQACAWLVMVVVVVVLLVLVRWEDGHCKIVGCWQYCITVPPAALSLSLSLSLSLCLSGCAEPVAICCVGKGIRTLAFCQEYTGQMKLSEEESLRAPGLEPSTVFKRPKRMPTARRAATPPNTLYHNSQSFLSLARKLSVAAETGSRSVCCTQCNPSLILHSAHSPLSPSTFSINKEQHGQD